MAHARPFWTSTLQGLSNNIKNTSMQGVLTPTIAFWVFGNPEGLPSPIFGNVSDDLTLPSKWVATLSQLKMSLQVLINLQTNCYCKSNDMMPLMRRELTTKFYTCKLTSELLEVAKTKIEINASRPMVNFLTMDIRWLWWTKLGMWRIPGPTRTM